MWMIDYNYKDVHSRQLDFASTVIQMVSKICKMVSVVWQFFSSLVYVEVHSLFKKPNKMHS